MVDMMLTILQLFLAITSAIIGWDRGYLYICVLPDYFFLNQVDFKVKMIWKEIRQIEHNIYEYSPPSKAKLLSQVYFLFLYCVLNFSHCNMVHCSQTSRL